MREVGDHQVFVEEVLDGITQFEWALGAHEVSDAILDGPRCFDNHFVTKLAWRGWLGDDGFQMEHLGKDRTGRTQERAKGVGGLFAPVL